MQSRTKKKFESMTIGAPHKPDIEPAAPGQTNIIPHMRDIHTYAVTDSEIDELCSEYMSVDFGLCTLFVGILVAFIVALVSTQMSDRVFAVFIAVAITAFALIIVFGIRTHRGRGRVRRRLEEIRGKSK